VTDGKSIRFLLIEDDDGHAAITIRSLEQNRGTTVVDRVADGEQALAYLGAPGRPQPDVILLDLNLPKVGGHEVLARIKTDPRLCTIPVVVLTTSDAETDRARAYREHANSYLVKPIDFERFRQMVRELSLYWGVWNQPPAGDPATAVDGP
jgi:CheY-like chemotaxis protein